MRYHVRSPHPRLTPFVSTLWLVEGPQLPHARERVLPSGEMQLLVNLHDDRIGDLSGVAVCGVFDRAIAIDTRDQRRLAGAVFRSGAAPALLGVPASELSNATLALSDILQLGDIFRHGLRERLLSAADPLAALERFLLSRLPPRLPASRSIQHAVRALDAGHHVRAVQTDLGWSPKRLRHRFHAEVGLAPKRFARIRRLQHVLRAAATSEPWAQIAAGCGYTDQAHLIRDFRELADTTPAKYRARNERDLNHVVIDQ